MTHEQAQQIIEHLYWIRIFAAFLVGVSAGGVFSLPMREWYRGRQLKKEDDADRR